MFLSLSLIFSMFAHTYYIYIQVVRGVKIQTDIMRNLRISSALSCSFCQALWRNDQETSILSFLEGFSLLINGVELTPLCRLADILIFVAKIYHIITKYKELQAGRSAVVPSTRGDAYDCLM